MPTLTVTDADLGKTISSSAGVLSSIKMLTAPTSYSDDYFCLTEPESIRPIFNMHISTSYVSDGSDLMSGGEILYDELVLSAIPPGSSFEIETLTEDDIKPTLTSLQPNTAVSGDPPLSLTCHGTNFSGNSIINFAGTNLTTTFGDPTKIAALVMPLIYPPGTVQVFVKDGELESTPLDFIFTAPPDPEIPPEE